jgi:hypothetical protein
MLLFSAETFEPIKEYCEINFKKFPDHQKNEKKAKKFPKA